MSHAAGIALDVTHSLAEAPGVALSYSSLPHLLPAPLHHGGSRHVNVCANTLGMSHAAAVAIY